MGTRQERSSATERPACARRGSPERAGQEHGTRLAPLPQIDSALQAQLTLGLINVPAAADLVELNCNNLRFCSQGGSGTAELGGVDNGGLSPQQNVVQFPAGTLDPVTGFGGLVGPQASKGLLSPGPDQLDGFTLFPNAASSQVGSGDVITEDVTENKTTTQIPTTLDFVFVTTPALHSYADTTGDSGAITYPEPTFTGSWTSATSTTRSLPHPCRRVGPLRGVQASVPWRPTRAPPRH